MVLATIAATIATSFQVLLPVVPVLVERQGPHGAAGAATAALFSGAVVGELLSPWLMTRLSASRLLIGGQLLYGLPSAIHLLPHAASWQMLTAAFFRGLGFGVAIVVSVALVSALSSPQRRGRAIGYFGLALSGPGILMPSIGVALLDSGHVEIAALIALASGLAGAALATRLPSSVTGPAGGGHTLLSALREPGVLALFCGFVIASCSFGGLFTFAPIALPTSGLASAAVFLFVVGGWRAVSRWLAGVLGDLMPPRLVLAGSLVLTLIGLIAIALPAGPVTVLISATAYGIGYGGMQTAVYLVMTQHRTGTQWGGISALWNSAIDLGSSFGGVVLGLSAARFGYASAGWVLPLVVAVSMPLFLLPMLRRPRAEAYADSATGSTG